MNSQEIISSRSEAIAIVLDVLVVKQLMFQELLDGARSDGLPQFGDARDQWHRHDFMLQASPSLDSSRLQL